MKKVLLGLLIFKITANASTQICREHYGRKSLKSHILQAADISSSQIALRSVVSQMNPTHDEYQYAKKTYELTVPKKIDKDELARLKKIADEKISPEMAEFALKKLLKSGFLLGPLHEVLYGQATQAFVSYGVDVSSEYGGFFISEYSRDFTINRDREKFNALSKRLSSKEDIDLNFQKKIAEDMLEKLNLLSDKDVNTNSRVTMTAEVFSSMPYADKLKYIISFYSVRSNEPEYWIKDNLLISPTQAITSMTALLEVRDLPGSKSFFRSLFQSSLKEINNNLLTKTDGKYSKKFTVPNLATLSGISAGSLVSFTSFADPLISSLGLSGAAVSVVSSALFASSYLLNYNHDRIYESTSKTFKNTLIKTKNIFQARSVKSKTIESLNDVTNDPLAKELAKDPNSDDALDLDFSYIKYDIQKDIQSSLDIPTWGNEFSKGIDNISLRINLILEKYQNLVNAMDPLLRKALAENNFSNLNLKLSSLNNDITKMKFFELLVDIQSIKTDTLTLSLFLDDYLQQANSFRKTLTNSESTYFLEDKIGNFQREVEILKATSNGIQQIQTQLSQNISTLNTIYHAQNIEVITNVKERLKINN